jgi:hypothetical protein
MGKDLPAKKDSGCKRKDPVVVNGTQVTMRPKMALKSKDDTDGIHIVYSLAKKKLRNGLRTEKGMIV